MTSQTFEQAEKFYNDNKKELLSKMYERFNFDIEVQEVDNGGDVNDKQVTVWFNGFSICYQSTDMNGNGKGLAHWNNDGANSGIDELREILINDAEFNELVASDEYWSNEYLNEFIAYFCEEFADKNNIAEMMQ